VPVIFYITLSDSNTVMYNHPPNSAWPSLHR